jgi:S-adenosylmethionine:tRNA ribosyltransferase-isomerase
MPLPPYITHKLQDKDRYQTVYAVHEGSAAAPTAGLHFTPELMAELEGRGISIARLTLHVGLGTFRPVKVDTIEEHHMHSEYFELSEEAAELINRTKENGGRVISVGTTSTRTLETVAQRLTEEDGDGPVRLKACNGWTDIFIYPGFKFQVVDALLTNFHAPKSTVLMLAAAFAGWDHLKPAYEYAVKNHYQLLSYGDSMFIY